MGAADVQQPGRVAVPAQAGGAAGGHAPCQPPPPPALEPADDKFWAAVRGLPKRQAQVAALRYLYQLDVADIARTLEITEGSVKQHLSRARARLVRDLNLSDAPAGNPAAEEVEPSASRPGPERLQRACLRRRSLPPTTAWPDCVVPTAAAVPSGSPVPPLPSCVS